MRLAAYWVTQYVLAPSDEIRVAVALLLEWCPTPSTAVLAGRPCPPEQHLEHRRHQHLGTAGQMEAAIRDGRGERRGVVTAEHPCACAERQAGRH